MPGPEIVARLVPMRALRIVARPDVLDDILWPADVSALRIAADDVMLIGDIAGDSELGRSVTQTISAGDPYAIVCDETGFSGAWVAMADFAPLAQAHIHWSLPEVQGSQTVVAQGLMAGVAVKLLVGKYRVLMLTPTVSAHELAGRLA